MGITRIVIILIIIVSLEALGSGNYYECQIPEVMRASWFSRENGENTFTEFNSTHMTKRGQSSCVNIPSNKATLQKVCEFLDPNTELITLFNQNPIPTHCRSSIEGVWHFGYLNSYRFTGECNDPPSIIIACEEPGNQFLITNQKFNISYRKCASMLETEDKVTEYSCLGDWQIGKNHYFAVANTRESRIDERYRCFLRNRDDDLYMGVSITAECNVLKSPESSPERLHLTPVKPEVVIPGCHFPRNFSGAWINTQNLDGDVKINETHMIETYYPHEGRYRQIIYVCREQRGARYMLTRLGIHGCQKEYVCFEFLPRHHNIIRFRKGQGLIIDDFSTVCAWVSFPSRSVWLYNILVARDPVPIRCPVAGKFNFTQKGEVPFETRILGGVTQNPIDLYYCKENISDFSVCDNDQKEIAIDADYCIAVDKIGRPVDIYTKPDYILSCIGFWKEDLQSYLITYDRLDPYSPYRCWVYQRADLDRVLISQAMGPICDVKQDSKSWNYTEGASVSLKMVVYERERDQCPLHFDDGTNPYESLESQLVVFDFDSANIFMSPFLMIIKAFVIDLFLT